LNQVDHANDVGFDLAGSTPDDLMAAAQSGVVDGPTVLGELARRVPGTAGDADTRGLLTSSISALKAMIDTGIVTKSAQETSGNMVRLWAMAVKRALVLGGPLLSTSDSKLDELDFSDTDLSFVTKGKLLIRRANTEGLFDTSIFIWSNLAHSFGIMPFEISSHFVEAAHIRSL